jgi:DNA-binding transcriptional MocR family regulator
VKALASLLELRLEGAAMDGDGLLPEAVEAVCRRGRVRVLYVVPTLQNPTTAIMPEGRRQRLAEVCRAHDVLLVEDNVDGFLVADAPPPLAAFAPERTFLVTSLSKSLAPGLRVGFMLAPEAYAGRAGAVVRTLSWMTAPLMAEVAATLVQDGTAARIVEGHRREARARQRIAAGVLAGASVETRPEAYHLWLHLPRPWPAADFAGRAREAGVAVTPAEVFSVDRASAPEAVRVALGAAPDRAALEGGLRVLARLLAAPPAPYLPVV